MKLPINTRLSPTGRIGLFLTIAFDWATKIETERNRSGRNVPMSDGLRNLLSLNAPIYMAFEVDTLSWHGILSIFSLDSVASLQFRPALETALQRSREQITQL